MSSLTYRNWKLHNIQNGLQTIVWTSYNALQLIEIFLRQVSSHFHFIINLLELEIFKYHGKYQIIHDLHNGTKGFWNNFERLLREKIAILNACMSILVGNYFKPLAPNQGLKIIDQTRIHSWDFYIFSYYEILKVQ